MDYSIIIIFFSRWIMIMFWEPIAVASSFISAAGVRESRRMKVSSFHTFPLACLIFLRLKYLILWKSLADSWGLLVFISCGTQRYMLAEDLQGAAWMWYKLLVLWQSTHGRLWWLVQRRKFYSQDKVLSKRRWYRIWFWNLQKCFVIWDCFIEEVYF